VSRRLLELHTDIDSIRTVVIEQVIEETPSIKTLIFKDHLSYNAKPGQFLMVWIPRIEELPMSVMFSKKLGYAAVTIRKHGIGSTALFNKKLNDVIGIRGPYGNSFSINKNAKNVMLAGGGTGLVPLMRFANFLTNSKIKYTLIIGAKTKNEVLFYNLAKQLVSKTSNKIIVTTEDGTFGIKGKVTDAIKYIINKEKFDFIYTCGPEMMMKNIFTISLDYTIRFQASLERYMKCGIGICASCCIGDKLVCTDGTIFNEKQLSVMPEFGKFFRDKSGRKSGY
jgi:dihydroorotate dehydrogenase electron transfer subunit